MAYAIACAALSAAFLFESSSHCPVSAHFLRNLPGGSFEWIASTMAFAIIIFCFFVPVLYRVLKDEMRNWDVDIQLHIISIHININWVKEMMIQGQGVCLLSYLLLLDYLSKVFIARMTIEPSPAA